MDADTAIVNARIVGETEVHPGQTVCLRDGRIAAVGSDAASAAPEGAQVVDAAGAYLAPGFIDLHFHGVHEFRVDESPAELQGTCRVLPRYGVTGFLPTVLPRPKGADAAHLATLASVRSEGAAMLGFFLEGPFLTLTGALPPDALGTNDPDRARSLAQAARPYVPIFGISPDFDGITDLIPVMRETGGPLFITHTHADVPQTQAAIEAGARHATHFYDVFPCPEERDPGVRPCGAVEAILADPRVTVDFILDGEHVDPVAVRMALETKGIDGVCLITDANVGAGLCPGRHSFAGITIDFAYEGAPARMVDGPYPGTLAGSGLTLDRAVRNAIDLLELGLPQAVRMVSANPARVLGLHERKGQVAPGFDADLVLLDPDLQVLRTWVAGKEVYRSGLVPRGAPV